VQPFGGNRMGDFAMAGTRTETDTFGPIEVANDVYWGAQSQRSIGNFKSGWRGRLTGSLSTSSTTSSG